jgi:tetratricopeptide (TPR) repeat protein
MNLGLLGQSEGDYQGAYTLYRRALAIEESASGPNSMRLANTLGNLGFLLRAVGQFDEALDALGRSMQIREEVLGPDSPELVQTLTNLGFLYRDMGRVGESVESFERSAAMIREALGEQSERLGAQYAYLAGSLNDAGEHQRALLVANEAGRIGASHPEAEWHFLPYWEEARARMGLEEVAPSDSLFALALGIIESRDGAESGLYAEMEARKCALQGDRLRSLEWFREAIRRGHRDPILLRVRELELIRDHPEYRRLAEEIRVVLRR